MRLRTVTLFVLSVSCVAAVCARADDDAKRSAEAEARFQAGVAHLRDGRPKMAAEEFRRAVRIEKDNPYFRKGLGQALAAQGKYDDAIDEFQEALKLNPNYVDVRNDLGSVLMLAGRRSDGMAQLLQAYNDPTNPTPAITARNLGRAYLDGGSYTEALNWFRTSVSRDSKYPDAQLGIADTLVAMGRLDEAVLQLEGAVKTMPESVPLILALGEAYYRAGRFKDARAKLEDVVRRDPAGRQGLRAADLLKKFP